MTALQSLAAWATLALCLAGNAWAAPRHVYLTWQGDTSRTITVNCQTLDSTQTARVYFDTKSRKGRHTDYPRVASGTSHQIPGLADGRRIHWIELTNLEPDTVYHFIVGDPATGFSPESKFRTIPSGSQKLRFVAGGDIGVGPAAGLLLGEAGKLSPLFGVVGGDLAYANDSLAEFGKWDAWLDLWETNMVTPAGLSVPMVLTVGNHELRAGKPVTRDNARFYFNYFAQDSDHSYYSRTFGKNLILLLLDSGHLTPHEGDQAAWLDVQLAAHAGVPHKMAVYHVPFYPSYRAFDGAGSVNGRKFWLPLFDKHNLTAAFENHDHTFKRTHLLRGNKADPTGTLYLGDGCWGMGARKVADERRWYEAKAASLQHFWCVDVSRNRVEYRAIDPSGQVFDVFPPDARGAAAAEQTFQKLLGFVPQR